jgi:hypothetical protein
MCRCVDDVLDAELAEDKQDVDLEDLNGGRLAYTCNSLELGRNQRCSGCKERRRRRRWARKVDSLLRPWFKCARKHGGAMVN